MPPMESDAHNSAEIFDILYDSSMHIKKRAVQPSSERRIFGLFIYHLGKVMLTPF